jgi:hypothetical protein
MKQEMTCPSCGIILAFATQPDAAGIVVSSPENGQYTLEIRPHGRTILYCHQCGAVRVWYPPPQRRRKPRAAGRGRSASTPTNQDKPTHEQPEKGGDSADT